MWSLSNDIDIGSIVASVALLVRDLARHVLGAWSMHPSAGERCRR
jgi:hypothetical protein